MSRRHWAWPLWPLYAVASRVKDALYTRRLLKPDHLTWPVLSVGSLSAGGAGKTPVVIALARLLQDAGYQPSILTRGYGRTGDSVERVDPSLPSAATRFGDEPVLLARSLGDWQPVAGNGSHLPGVWVAPQRYLAGRAAEDSTQVFGRPPEEHRDEAPPNLQLPEPPPVHLLDDGFQHRQLSRTLDIALITLEDLDDELLPVGNLREAACALHRAHVLVVREEERERMLPRIRSLGMDSKPLWTITRALHFPASATVLSAGLKPLGFCALARPENFEMMLRQAGCDVTDTLAFRDHHAYTPRDIQHILGTAKKLSATGFVTTEKDAVKLTPDLRSQLETHGPLVIVALQVTFTDPTAVLRDVASSLMDSGQRMTNDPSGGDRR